MAKTIPLRMCIVCRNMYQRNLLSRVVKKPDGSVTFDETGKTEGRGAYVCKSDECIAKCRKGKILNKQLHTDVPQEIYDKL
jgi:predicted RNA-binding protein YlxR (DUF448 family)